MPSRDLKLCEPKLQTMYDRIRRTFEAAQPAYKLVVICTLRPFEEQLAAFLGGFSKIDPRKKRGKHMENSRGLSEAIDVMIVERVSGLSTDTLLSRARMTQREYDLLWWGLSLIVKIEGGRSGEDWDGDGVPVGPDPDESFRDAYHLELIPPGPGGIG